MADTAAIGKHAHRKKIIKYYGRCAVIRCHERPIELMHKGRKLQWKALFVTQDPKRYETVDQQTFVIKRTASAKIFCSFPHRTRGLEDRRTGCAYAELIAEIRVLWVLQGQDRGPAGLPVTVSERTDSGKIFCPFLQRTRGPEDWRTRGLPVPKYVVFSRRGPEDRRTGWAYVELIAEIFKALWALQGQDRGPAGLPVRERTDSGKIFCLFPQRTRGPEDQRTGGLAELM